MEDNIIGQYINRNSQVHRVNVNDFLITHHSPPDKSGLTYPKLEKKQILEKYEDSELIYEGDHIQYDIEDEVCAICFNELELTLKRGKPLRILKCKHIFCATCIEKWINKKETCPLCMRDIGRKKLN